MHSELDQPRELSQELKSRAQVSDREPEEVGKLGERDPRVGRRRATVEREPVDAAEMRQLLDQRGLTDIQIEAREVQIGQDSVAEPSRIGGIVPCLDQRGLDPESRSGCDLS